MTEQEYNAAEGIRRSDLWLMKDSPEKFKWHQEHPEAEEESQEFIFGRACHKLILEPSSFGMEYAVAPNVDRRTKSGKEQWTQFCEENTGKTVISRDDYAMMLDMLGSVSGNALANDMLSGQHEVPFFWTDRDTGEKCKCKADVVRRADGKYVVIDYKTTKDASTEAFNRNLFRYGYHVQAAMYTEGLQTAIGLDYRPRFLFVAQEKKAPYGVNVIEVSDDVMQYGDQVYHKLLRQYHECNEVDIWPGYCGDVPNFTQMPKWLSTEDEG